KTTPVMTVSRSRLRSTTVEPAIEPPSCPPPNMSDRPPPRPECSRIRKIIASADVTQITIRIVSRSTAEHSIGRTSAKPSRECEGVPPHASAPAYRRSAASDAVAHDPGEVVGIERRPADQRTVDLGHGHQVGDVAGLDAPPVLDAHGVG